MEVGGILIGTKTGRVVRILDSRPVDIEYGRGALFLLTDADHEALARTIRSTEEEVASRGLQVVGYYQSHTRRGGSLLETDRETYDRHFSEPGDVCLIMRPEKENATTIAIYVRDGRGNVTRATQSEALVESSDLQPVPLVVSQVVEQRSMAQAVAATPSYETNPIPSTAVRTAAPAAPALSIPSLTVTPDIAHRSRWQYALPAMIAAALLVAGVVWMQIAQSSRSQVNTLPAQTPVTLPEASPPPAAPAVEATKDSPDNTTVKPKPKSKRGKSRRARTRIQAP